jgi:hypothetical protein
MVGLREFRKVIQPISSAQPGSHFSMMSLNGSTEFGLQVFKRRTRGKQEDRYTIGVWEGDVLVAISHDACLESALAALGREMERDRGGNVVLSPNTGETTRD